MIWDGYVIIDGFSLDKNTLTELADRVLEKATKYMIPRAKIIADES